jgi:hypothetical protein
VVVCTPVPMLNVPPIAFVATLARTNASTTSPT